MHSVMTLEQDTVGHEQTHLVERLQAEEGKCSVNSPHEVTYCPLPLVDQH